MSIVNDEEKPRGVSDLFINRGALKYLTYRFQSPGAGLLMENTAQISQGQWGREASDWKDTAVNFFPCLLQAGSATPSNQTPPHGHDSPRPFQSPPPPHTGLLRRARPTGEAKRGPTTTPTEGSGAGLYKRRGGGGLPAVCREDAGTGEALRVSGKVAGVGFSDCGRCHHTPGR